MRFKYYRTIEIACISIKEEAFELLQIIQELEKQPSISTTVHHLSEWFIESKHEDFVVVTDFLMRLKMGKRIHLCEYEADSLADCLYGLFSYQVEIPRIRHGKRQTLDTLINEEALLLAKFLRNEKNEWKPRIVIC